MHSYVHLLRGWPTTSPQDFHSKGPSKQMMAGSMPCMESEGAPWDQGATPPQLLQRSGVISVIAPFSLPSNRRSRRHSLINLLLQRTYFVHQAKVHVNRSWLSPTLIVHRPLHPLYIVLPVVNSLAGRTTSEMCTYDAGHTTLTSISRDFAHRMGAILSGFARGIFLASLMPSC